MSFLLQNATKVLRLRTPTFYYPACIFAVKNRQSSTNAYPKSSTKGSKTKKTFYTLLLVGGIAAGYHFFSNEEKCSIMKNKYLFKRVDMAAKPVDEQIDHKQLHLQERTDLPTYKLNEVARHTSMDAGVWVVYGRGVYDVTHYVPIHPGGDQILLAAGGNVAPFFLVTPQHADAHALKYFEAFRVGNLIPDEVLPDEDTNTVWGKEPKRHRLLNCILERPYNGETPPQQLVEQFFTPNEVFFVCNHLAVPDIDPNTYKLQIEIETPKAIKDDTSKQNRSLSLAEIKSLPKHTITAALMSAENRRKDTGKFFFGPAWGPGAVGNAKWTGAKLRDVLLAMGVQPNDHLYVIFEGADIDPSSNPYSSSIPLSKALEEHGDVLIAYEMNGKPLSRDHGFPVRALVPGYVANHSVKWLTRIAVSEQESTSHWYLHNYRSFSPSTTWRNVDYSKSPPIQEMPVTSAICTPLPGERVKVSKNGTITVRGYAWSGGGRRIIRVDLTTDGGKSWNMAELEQGNELHGRHYGWTLWTAQLPVDKTNAEQVEIWAKAVDSSFNVQPESFQNIFNFRGLLNNAYHRVKVQLN